MGKKTMKDTSAGIDLVNFVFGQLYIAARTGEVAYSAIRDASLYLITQTDKREKLAEATIHNLGIMLSQEYEDFCATNNVQTQKYQLKLAK